MRVDGEADAAVLAALRQQASDVLREELGGARTAVLLDFPRHPNFGDSLIWLGQEALLRRLGVRVTFRSSLYDYDPRDLSAVLRDDTIVLLQGGGNLGDLYPHHDEARRRVIRDFPSVPKLVLPQSLYATDPRGWLRDASRDYAEGCNVRLLLREGASLERAAHLLPYGALRFCPDLALWAPLRPRPVAGGPVLALARTDDEAGPAIVEASPAEQSDWRRGAVAGKVAGVLERGARHDDKARFLTDPARRRVQSALLASYAALNCLSASRQLAARGAVATNRLHAHIACVLLGIPHAVTDNSYGKIAAVFRYTGAFSTAHWAPTLGDAVRLAEDLLTSGPDQASSRSRRGRRA